MWHTDGTMLLGHKRLAGGPLHPAATQDVDVDVVDWLASVCPVVDDNPVAFGQARCLSTLLSNYQQVAQQLGDREINKEWPESAHLCLVF